MGAQAFTQTCTAEHAACGSGLEQRIAALEARVERLGRGDLEARLDEGRHDQLKAIVREALADADARAGSPDSHALAGYDDGFFLSSADDAFRIEVAGQIQARYVVSRRRNATDDRTHGGFEITRARLMMEGHIVDPRFEYALSGDTSNEGGDFRLQDAWIGFEIVEDAMLLFGRFRPPFLREHEVSSKRQLLVERSLIALQFGQRRDPGVQLALDTDRCFAGAAFMDRSNDLFGDNRWLASARAELALVGRRRPLRDFTSRPDDEPVLAVGAGATYESNNRIDPLPDSEAWAVTADVSAEARGINLMAAVVVRHRDRELEPRREQCGWIVQGGAFIIDDRWEIIARYETGDADDQSDRLSVVTVGVNRYVARHDLKLTVDFGYAFSEVAAFWSSDLAGWRADAPGADGQFVVRTQWQMLF